MAGEDVPVGGDGHVLAPGAAAPQPLDDAGALGQVHVEVEEVHVLPAHQLPGQLLILLLHLGQILLLDGEGVVQGAAGGLHRHVAEAQVGQVHHVGGEIQVLPGKGAPGVVVLGAPSSHQLLELGDDHVIAPLPSGGGAHVVVDLLAAVQGQHHVGHLPVDIVDVLVIEQHAVGGDGKAEHLVMLFLQGAGVGHRLLHRVHGHEGLAAEEVDLNVPALARLLHHPVDGLLGGLGVHGHPVAGAEVAGAGEAVPAAQVAVVGHVEAQGLHHRLTGQLHGGLRVQIVVAGEQQTLVLESPQLLPGLLQLRRVILGQRLQNFLGAVLSQLLLPLHPGEQVVAHLVQHVDRAAVYVRRQVLAQGGKGMYHSKNPLSFSLL